MRSSILTAALLAVFTPTRDAEACSPPLVYWGIGSTIPADGTTDVPIDAGITVRGQPWGDTWGIEPLAGYIEVLVTRDGEPVPGTLVHSAFETTHWRPDTDLEPNARHEVHVVIDNYSYYEELSEDIEGERTFHFVTGDAAAPAPKTPDVPEATVEGFEQQLIRCVDDEEDLVGSCGECWETEVVGEETHLRFEAAHPPVDGRWPEGSVATLRVGPEPDRDGSRALTVYLAEEGAAWSGGLGARRDWGSDQVCFQVTVVTPGGLSSEGPVECLAIAPTVEPPPIRPDRPRPKTPNDVTPREDAEADLQPSGGCETTGHSAPAWLLLALLPALRPRQQLTGR